jgi:hypothetical protein
LRSFNIIGTTRRPAYMLAELEITVSNLWKAAKETVPYLLRDTRTLPSTRMMLKERQESIDRRDNTVHTRISGEAPEGNQLAKANLTTHTQAMRNAPEKMYWERQTDTSLGTVRIQVPGRCAAPPSATALGASKSVGYSSRS